MVCTIVNSIEFTFRKCKNMKMAIWRITTHFVVEGHICDLERMLLESMLLISPMTDLVLVRKQMPLGTPPIRWQCPQPCRSRPYLTTYHAIVLCASLNREYLPPLVLEHFVYRSSHVTTASVRTLRVSNCSPHVTTISIRTLRVSNCSPHVTTISIRTLRVSNCSPYVTTISIRTLRVSNCSPHVTTISIRRLYVQ